MEEYVYSYEVSLFVGLTYTPFCECYSKHFILNIRTHLTQTFFTFD